MDGQEAKRAGLLPFSLPENKFCRVWPLSESRSALAGVGLFAAGLAREWFGEHKDKADNGDKD